MKCSVCKSRWVKEINIRCLARNRSGESLREIADNYEGISYSALQRHASKCLQLKDDTDLVTHKDYSLEDLKNDAADLYSKAIIAGDPKRAADSLRLLVSIEELISKRDDRALAAGKGDEVIEIELRWADDWDGTKPTYHAPNTDYGILKELPIGNDDVINPVQEPVCTMDDYKALALASKPTSLIKNDTGEIIGVDTPAGKIWKGPQPRELPIDEDDRERGVLRRRLMSDGTLIEDMAAFKETYQEE